MKQFNRAMEIFWLITSVLTLLIAVHISRIANMKDSLLAFTMPLVALLLFFMRRHVRKNAKHKDKKV